MRIATYRWGGRRHVGVLSNDAREITPIDLRDRQEQVQSRGAQALLEHLAEGKDFPAVNGTRLPLAAVTLEAPLPRPRRNLWCVGRNYRAHAKELQGTIFKNDDAAAKIDQWPIVFTKVPECVVAPGDAIRLPGKAASEQIDYEAELAVVIGRKGTNIPASRAMDYVWGYTIINDVTARDVQMRHVQWDMGKSFDTFCPMGPWLVDATELDGQRHAGAAVGQRRTATGRAHRGSDLRHSDADRDDLARHHALPGRRDRDRHAGGCRHGHESAHVA